MTDVPSPDAPVSDPVAASHEPLTSAMLDALRQTRPWVRFLSILGFVGSALTFLAALGLAGFSAFQLVNEEIDDGAIFIGMALAYMLIAVLYLIPSRYLFRYAAAIAAALDAPRKAAAVELALQHQKSFWKFVGLVALIGLLLWMPLLAAFVVPNFLIGQERNKEKRTMADIRSIAIAVEAYAVDHDRYPDVASIGELATTLEPRYIRTLPRRDHWGTPYLYQAAGCDPGPCQQYYIASAAKDGRFEKTRLTEWPAGKGGEQTGSWDADIVYSTGTFLRYREGIGGNSY